MILKYVHARQKPGYFSPPKHARSQTNDACQCKRVVAWNSPEYTVIVQGNIVVPLRQTLANCSFVSHQDKQGRSKEKDTVANIEESKIAKTKDADFKSISILNARYRQPQKGNLR